jgi:hypothetical protein
MGLDTFVSRSPGRPTLTAEDAAVFGASGLELCGGFYSDGLTSIRGKVYAGLVFEVTGVSLYQDWIDPADVSSMARALDARSADDLARSWDDLTGGGGPGHSSQETAQLKRFFDLCAERGLGLVGWW